MPGWPQPGCSWMARARCPGAGAERKRVCIRICQGQNAPSSLPSLREAGALSVMTALVLGCPSAVILPELAGVSTAREGVLPRSSLFLTPATDHLITPQTPLEGGTDYRHLQTGAQRLGADLRHSW